MKECFLGVSTPHKAPVDVLFAIAKMSDTEVPYIPMCMSGWQNDPVANMEIADSISEFPDGFAAVWLSLTERKVYEIDVDFSNVMKERVLQTIKKGFKNRQGKQVTYTHFKASLFPDGVVKLHLLSSSKILSLDYTIQGTATSEYNDAFLEQFGEGSKIRSLNDYCDIYYKEETKESDDSQEITQIEEQEKEETLQEKADFINQIALPNQIWEKYYTRYNYKIRFVFENPQSSLYSWSPKFTNAESFSCQSGVNEDVVVKYPATICSLNLWWRTQWDQYTSYFYFDEDEILTLFETAFASHPDQKGELIINVGKYDNSFKIELHIGMDVYAIRKTEIRAFFTSLFDLEDDGGLLYKNYEGNHKNQFNCL